MPVVIREDTEDQYNWDRIEETYNLVDDVETLARRLTIYDNGQTKDETFSNSDPGSNLTFDLVVLEDAPEGEGLAPWDRIEDYFIEGYGRLVRKLMLDNGVIRLDYFSETGEIARYVVFDNPLPNTYPTPSLFIHPIDQYRGIWELGPGGAVPDGVHDWYLKFWNENSITGEQSVQYDTDDFRRIYEVRVDGVLIERETYDISDVNGREEIHNWDFIGEEYDASGSLTERTTIHDDGTVETETFSDGMLTQLIKEDNPTSSGDGAETWDRIEETYELVEDAATLTRRLTTYGNGQTKDEQFSAFDPRSGSTFDLKVVQDSPDGDGIAAWDRIEEYRVEGYSEHFRKMILDNGVIRFDYFDPDGDLSQYVTYDNPLPQDDPAIYPFYDPTDQYRGVWELGPDEAVPDGAHDWYLIYWYQGSDPGESVIQFDMDDFRRIVETWVDGVLQERVTRDISEGQGRPDIREWEHIFEKYDSTGHLTERVTRYDNEVVETESFAAGVRVQHVKEDNPAFLEDGIYNWDQITLDYDTSGHLTRRLTEYDDGATTLEEYTGGVRTLIRRTDDTDTPEGANNWQQIENQFDPVAGLVTYRLYDYDDGTSLELFYENGQLLRRLQTDGFGGDTANWAFIETLYGNGQITQRTTTFDDSDQRVETFEDGRLAAIVDSSAAYLGAAPTICTFTEDCADSPLGLRAGIDQRETILGADGQVEVRKTLYSNDDQTAALYENGRIIEQHQYDGDGDQAWLARILFYSDGSVIDRLNFFAEDELPDEFAISIPPVSVPVSDDTTTGVPGQGAFDAPDLSEFDSRSALVSAPEPDAFDFA